MTKHSGDPLEHEDKGGDKERTELDEPVLDGADDHSSDDVDPRKGMSDPALIRDVEQGKKTTNPYG